MTDVVVAITDRDIVGKILRLVYEAKINIKLEKEITGNMAGYCECPNCLNKTLSYYYDGDNSTGDCSECNFKV